MIAPHSRVRVSPTAKGLSFKLPFSSSVAIGDRLALPHSVQNSGGSVLGLYTMRWKSARKVAGYDCRP